jgi:hypothetical protein
MGSRLGDRKRWPLLAVIVLTVVFAGEILIRAGAGGAKRVARAAPQPVQLAQQPIPGPAPQGRDPKETITVYTCLRCGREIGRGTAAPAPPCPFCGFAGDPGRVIIPMQPHGRGQWLWRLRPTFLYTVGIEGSLLAGLVVAGVLRLTLDRARQRQTSQAEG